MKNLLITLLLFQFMVCFAPEMKILILFSEPIKREFTLTEKIQAILDVESSNGMNTYNPGEVEAVGILQIHPIMVREINRILGYEKYQLSDRESDKKSIEMFLIYQNHYNPTMDFETMARSWVAGPKGMKKVCSLNYYNIAINKLN
jgi:hypothetical protein